MVNRRKTFGERASDLCCFLDVPCGYCFCVQVTIPFNCVSGMAPQINPKLDVERYLQVVTADGFDFWFTGFLNYDSAFATLLAALHDVGRHTESLLKGAS